MDKAKIKRLVKQKESPTLEFKLSLSEPDRIVETACSFANTKGGVILIGVSDKGVVRGLDIGRQTVEGLTNKIVDNTDPSLYPEISVENIDNKDIIMINVEPSPNQPHTAFGRPFIRVGKNTKLMKQSEYEQLLLKRKNISFDSQVCEGASLKDIDEAKVKWFLGKAKLERRLDIYQTTPLQEALRRLDLMKDSALSNAAILLFGKNPQAFFHQAEVRCARFKGTEPLEFIDMKVFGKDMIAQREDSLAFVKEHIRLGAVIKGTERVERWEYPLEAVREAITNAICHRDYGLTSNVQVRIFADRIEIWGCGSLPPPLSIDDLKTKHDSVLRNVLIGKCFFLIKFIEQWGTGTNRIIKECLKHGLPEPLFEEIAGNLVVSFRKYRITGEYLAGLGLNRRQRMALEYIKEKGRITNRDLQELCPRVTRKTVARDMKELIEKRLIRQRGKKKGVYYDLF